MKLLPVLVNDKLFRTVLEIVCTLKFSYTVYEYADT